MERVRPRTNRNTLALKTQYTLQYLELSSLLFCFPIAALLSHAGVWFIINILQVVREEIREIERPRPKQLHLQVGRGGGGWVKGHLQY